MKITTKANIVEIVAWSLIVAGLTAAICIARSNRSITDTVAQLDAATEAMKQADAALKTADEQIKQQRIALQVKNELIDLQRQQLQRQQWDPRLKTDGRIIRFDADELLIEPTQRCRVLVRYVEYAGLTAVTHASPPAGEHCAIAYDIDRKCWRYHPSMEVIDPKLDTIAVTAAVPTELEIAAGPIMYVAK